MKPNRKRPKKGYSTEAADPVLIGRPADSRKKTVSQIRDLIEPLCEAEGVELVHIEYQGEASGRILRFYIDKTGGVTIDDCVRISRQASDLLDIYLGETGSYNLEVSSPGPNRPLAKQNDYEKYKGRQAKIKTTRPIEGRKTFKGVLTGITADSVKLSVEGTLLSIPFDQIARAQLAD